MVKGLNLVKVSALVKSILEQNKMARNSDPYLYLQVIERQAELKNIDLSMISVDSFFYSASREGFANYETVRRARQKIQREYPELAASEKVKAYRAENEEMFREYARGEV